MIDWMRWFPVRAAFLGVLMACAGSAGAELIDRVEVRRAGQEAEIVITFATQVQYQRHAPLSNGGLLQLFLGQPGALPSNVAVPETLTQAAPGLLAPFTLSYPDLNGALSIRFDHKTTWRVRPGQDQRSLSIFVPAMAEPAKVVPPGQPPSETAPEAAKPVAKPAPVLVSQVAPAWEKDAKELMAQIKEAVKRGDHVAAIEQLNRLLNLPPNLYSEEAQIMIAEEREANGETAKAIAEYTLYNKLYPDGGYAIKARQRLAALAKASPVAAAGAKPEKAVAARREFDTGWVFSGSLAQNYYHGNSHIEILIPPAPGEFNPTTDTLSTTDQSALVTSLDMNYRRRTTDTDTRFVLRDTDTRNFLSGQADVNRLNAAYFERNDKALGYLVRLGRQTSSSGGVLGRFDGVWGGYNLTPSLRANVVAGYPVEYNVNWNKSFMGASVDLLPQPEKLTGSAYAIVQRVDGVDDRQAIGLEARYFDSRANYFGMLDYDVMFGELNIAMLQGNYQMENGTNLFFLLDHRKAPILQLTAGYSGPSSWKTALATLGASELESRALLKTADADLFQLGFTRQVTPRFQFGADYRLAVVSDAYSFADDNLATPPTPAAGTGNIHVYSAQFIGNSLLKENDVGVANISLIRAPTYNGLSATLSHVLNLERWRIDSIIGYYAQDDDSGDTLQRWNPVFRFSYRLRDNWSIESELGMEKTTRTGSNAGVDRRDYFFVGYRWEW
jgi:hypothetical protein